MLEWEGGRYGWKMATNIKQAGGKAGLLLALLTSCATNADHYFKAEDAAQLNDAFASVNSGLAELHLSE